MGQTLFCSCLQHPELLILAVCFDIMVDNLIANVFISELKKSKASHDEQVFLEISLFGT